MKSDISISHCTKGYDWCTNVILVRGIGHSAVRVILRPTHHRCGYNDEMQVAIKAAKIAAKKGWRKIVVAPDDLDGETIRGFNIHQYHHEKWKNGFVGIFLGFTSIYNN